MLVNCLKTTFLLVIVLVSVAHSKEYRQGKEFSRAYGGGEDQGKVLEFFAYSSPHSLRLHSMLKGVKQELSGHIRFEKVPVLFGGNILLGRTYYALESMGAGEELHDEIFAAIHLDNKRLNSLDAISAFLETKGVNRQAFVNAFHYSPAVRIAINAAVEKSKRYSINSFPLLVIHGKYKVHCFRRTLPCFIFCSCCSLTYLI